MSTTRVSILIPTHNRAAILAKTLACVERLIRPENVAAELIVVANNCSDNTVEISRSAVSRLSFPGKVVEEFTPGLNPARNRAVHESSGDILALLDDDVAIDHNWLCDVVRSFEETPADLIGGRARLWWEAVERPEWFTSELDSLLSCVELGETPVEIYKAVGIVGANFWFRRHVWETIGDFRDGLDRCGTSKLGGGDVEFIERALRAGFRAFHTPLGSIHHWVAPGRVEPHYLLGVASGNARGRVLLKQRMSFPTWLRCLLGHSYLMIWHGCRGAVTQAVRGRDAAMHDWALCWTGKGGLLGIVDRLWGSAPHGNGGSTGLWRE